jgi:hypothetical protein
MKISAILHTSEFRADHSADVEIAYEVLPGETVEDLVRRCQPEYIGKPAATDKLVLRIVQEPTQPQREGDCS